MRLVFIADGRSMHAQNWLKYFMEIGDEILLLSTFPCPEIPGVRIHLLPGLFRVGNSMINSKHVVLPERKSLILRFALHPPFYKVLNYIWQQTRTLDVLIQIKEMKATLRDFNPDVVHSMRIQNEGYVAGWAKYHPLIMSSWGSDFIYTARKFPIHRILTRYVLRKPDAFIADCLRDIRLSHVYGLPNTVPTRNFPGNGGIDRALFHLRSPDLPERERSVICVRGYSSVVRIDTLLKAFKIMLRREQSPVTKLILLIPSGAVSIVNHMLEKLGLSKLYIVVKSSVSFDEMIHLLQTIAVSVSPMLSDGTPISMLEAMACGAFPVMSNLESVREWISHGQNGLLFNPANPEELAACLQEALDNVSLRQTAQKINAQLINDRADYAKVMPHVREFYQMVASKYKAND